MAETKRRQLAFAGAREVRRETFDGLPIIDAKADFTVVLRDSDIRAAKGNRKDAANCVLAKACARQVGASRVAFFRQVAYLDLPDAEGNRNVVRFFLDDDAAAIVRAFDRGRSVKGEVSVTLKAPTTSRRLDHLYQLGKERRERRRKALIKGELLDADMTRKRLHRQPRVADMDVRNGTGMFQIAVVKPSKRARSKEFAK